MFITFCKPFFQALYTGAGNITSLGLRETEYLFGVLQPAVGEQNAN